MGKIKRIKELSILDDFKLLIIFYSEEVRILDLKPIMEEYPLFHALEENNLFKNAKIDIGGFGIVWNEEFSISAGDAYERSTQVVLDDKDVMSNILITSLVNARKSIKMTQSELSRISKLPQPTIAKVESLKIDPRLSTIINIADSLGYRLEIVPKEHSTRKL